MSKLREKYIQDRAIDYLTNHYKEKYEKNKIYSRSEVRTNTNFFNKRADGLICLNSKKQAEHTISIEAKSHRTFGSFLSNWNDEKLVLHSFLISLILGLLTIFFSQMLDWYWIFLITLSSIVILFFITFIILNVLDLSHYQFINVINQIHQYPANEKWIAISKDSLNLMKKVEKPDFFKKTDYDKFIEECKKQKIGLLIITRRKITILVNPKYTSGNYLDCYSINDKIRNYLK